MKTSDTLDKLAPALLKAQKAIKCAIKDSINPHFKNRYADVSAVIEAVKDPLNNNGIVFLQTPSPSEGNTISLSTRLIHESGEWIEDTATCPLPKNDPQGFGSALTYLRRYSLGAILGVPSEDDDGEGARPQPAQHKPVESKGTPVTNVQMVQPDTLKQLSFFQKAEKTRPMVEKVLATKGFNTVSDMDEETARKCVAWIESQLKLQEKAK